MLLLIDAGNTRIKWALAEDGAAPGVWIASGAVAHADLNHLPASWAQHGVNRALVSNVAGSKLRDQLQLMIPTTAISWFASTAQLAGMRNAYRNPSQLGCDRFAAALGARALAPGRALIVATCGTATTIDAVSADGVFLGGMILPGLGLMATSLARNTAQLPEVAPGATLPAGFADNTADAILSGCLSAQAGAIERACALHGATACIVSGGAAQYIGPVLRLPIDHRIVDNIVLIGLHSTVTSSPLQDSPC
ncbi:type III pantothenate kinase [Massilia pseudoviolaceinigra]|uniref:type III pantothenate kinase n=1 Tax=Massilia pseudoviolaceinigra TaxID=3057165 RepID=UPI0027963F71|nr:type III pantothenate kinase [Massilia sp. CCM 9206]MDQ1922117.1 type III pantothenate kinase [Massilia sp. CCM 9206]